MKRHEVRRFLQIELKYLLSQNPMDVEAVEVKVKQLVMMSAEENESDD